MFVACSPSPFVERDYVYLTSDVDVVGVDLYELYDLVLISRPWLLILRSFLLVGACVWREQWCSSSLVSVAVSFGGHRACLLSLVFSL